MLWFFMFMLQFLFLIFLSIFNTCLAMNMEIRKYENVNKEQTIKIAIVFANHYVHYGQIAGSLHHAIIDRNIDLQLSYINTSQIPENELTNILHNYDGILVPGGEFKYDQTKQIAAIKFAREQNKPILGICLGAQLMAIEFAQNILNLDDVGSSELRNHKNNIIDTVNRYLPSIKKIANNRYYIKYQNTLMGQYNFDIKQNSKIYDIYKSDKIIEECSNSYAINNKYTHILTENGMIISGTYSNTNLPAIIEYQDHPWFIGVQFHPEFQSTHQNLDPIFDSFITHLIENQK